jgi:magnesium-protoporphyrin IX monomethyl ester (oxidative) cyclase
MYVRDHHRPAFHAALGVDPTDYDYTVFRITSEISRQTFPLELDLDNPKFHAGLETLLACSRAIAEARAQGGVLGKLKHGIQVLRAAATFVRLYLLPVKANALPADIRLQPVW